MAVALVLVAIIVVVILVLMRKRTSWKPEEEAPEHSYNNAVYGAAGTTDSCKGAQPCDTYSMQIPVHFMHTKNTCRYRYNASSQSGNISGADYRPSIDVHIHYNSKRRQCMGQPIVRR